MRTALAILLLVSPTLAAKKLTPAKVSAYATAGDSVIGFNISAVKLYRLLKATPKAIKKVTGHK